ANYALANPPYALRTLRHRRGALRAFPAMTGIMTRFDRPSIHHDLDEIAHLDLGTSVQPVQDAKALRRTIDARHPVRQRLHGIAGLHGNDFYAQRAGRLDFLKRQPAE